MAVTGGRSRWPAPKAADPSADLDTGPDADPESVGRKILLDQLTGRARTRSELADKLAGRNVPDDVATRLLDRFEEVGLVDDGAFARTWVGQRQQGKGLSRRVLAQELRRKRIDDEVAKEALAERSTGYRSTGTGAMSSASTTAPTPSFSLMRFSISSARSGLSFRKERAFSLPWPSWSPS